MHQTLVPPGLRWDQHGAVPDNNVTAQIIHLEYLPVLGDEERGKHMGSCVRDIPLCVCALRNLKMMSSSSRLLVAHDST